MQSDEERVFQDLRRVMLAAHRQHVLGATRGEDRVLRCLCQNGGAAQPGQLSQSLGISTARVAAIVGSLTRKGQVVREPLGNDRRCAQIRLTDAGRARLDLTYARMQRRLRYILDALGPEDAQAFCRILHRLPDILCAPDPTSQKGET